MVILLLELVVIHFREHFALGKVIAFVIAQQVPIEIDIHRFTFIGVANRCENVPEKVLRLALFVEREFQGVG
ncbi:hypothetical protein D3C86_1576990 [compost metagenome]